MIKRTFSAALICLLACLGMQAAQVDTLMVRSESMNKDIKIVAIRPDKAMKGRCILLQLIFSY